MRKFALAVLDNEDNIIDRYNLDIVSEPQGLGFTLNISTIKGSLKDLITMVQQTKNVIKFNINQVNNAYSKSQTLVAFIQKYSTAANRMVLVYTVNNVVKLCEGRVTSLTKTEQDEFKNLIQGFEYTPIEPFFIKRENTIIMELASEGKSYPLNYPYSYGMNIISNNEISNPYILEVPVTITIKGGINNPTISLADKETGTVYNTVRFSNLFLTSEESIIINSAQKKVIKINSDGSEEDFSPEVDPTSDTFLFAKSGDSILLINDNDVEEGFKLVGSWREYTL